MKPALGAGVAALLLAGSGVGAQTMRAVSTSRPLAGEKVLNATIEFGAGMLRVAPAAAGELYRMDLGYDADRNSPVHQYDARTGALRLGLQGDGSAGIRVTSRAQLAQRAVVSFAPSVPLALVANLGAAEATLDLGGVTLTSLAVRGGASRSVVRFTTPTRGSCTRATFVVGAAELDVLGLANAGCAELSVESGVGRTVLSFDGSWRRDQRAEVSLAMGSLTLRVPSGTGVRLVTSRFLAALEATGLERDGNVWSTAGFDTAPRKLTVLVNASAAGVALEWLPK